MNLDTIIEATETPVSITTAGPITKGPLPGTGTIIINNSGDVDPDGKTRSENDAEAAELAGFSLKRPLFERGTRVNSTGVDNARTSRLEFDTMPSAREAHMELEKEIRLERRRDYVVRASNLLLKDDGKLTTQDKPEKGIMLSGRSFPQLVKRLDIPAGGRYLQTCPPELRATNVNHWINERRTNEDLLRKDGEDVSPKELQLRLRGRKGAKEIFAVTSPRYTAHDADLIAQAVAQASPAGARGSVHYDGYRARGDVLFHSNVRPRHYVVGEIFKAGVSWSTDDTGGGSIVVRAVVWQNLCLNLIIIDRSAQETVRLRHQGSVDELARGFRAGFDAALGKIDHFVHAWDDASEEALEDIIWAMDGSDPSELLDDIIAASARGLLDQGLITIPGRRENIVDGIVEAWDRDHSGVTQSARGANRARLANALTRYAHEGGLDPWQQDVLQAEAGQVLYGEGRYARIPVLGV